ncbi:MAG TPA: transcription antitermination factor NusB [Candidatus Mcinerneyibacteriales bacterium]|nr:transcription antitermination factor NusB [Candidatus Mcinerneyibacteriales bacterium]
MTDERLELVKILLKWQKTLYINRILEEKPLSPFVLFHARGVIENLLYLDHAMAPFVRNDPGNEARWILRLAFHELLFSDKSEDYAATNEAVRLAGRFAPSKKGFVNAVIRNFLRQGKAVTLPRDPVEGLSVKFSLPLWITRLLAGQYGTGTLEGILSSFRRRRDYDIRINLDLTDHSTYKKRLEEASASFAEWPGEWDGAFRILGHHGPGDLPGYREGLFFVQDLGAQIAASLLLPVCGPVLDVGSAPGGKLMFLAPFLKKSEVEALDISARRIKRLSENLNRLRIPLPRMTTQDFLKYEPGHLYSRIFLDVPCSGLGVLSKKCDIAYRLSPEALESLKSVQRDFLDKALTLLAPGGELVYSTCTINQEENDGQVEAFLSRHGSQVTLVDPSGRKHLNELPFRDIVFRQGVYRSLPPEFPGDGMFGAVLQRRA